MKNNRFLVFIFILCITTAFAQNKKDVLMKINGSPVYSSEFSRVYKKNLDLVQEKSQKDIDGYLDLFVDYKLKIAEAYAQGLDDKNSYKNELAKYRNQLSRNYIFETKITEDLAKEAYERGKEELNVSHILIKLGYDAMPQDTLAAYNKINGIREKAINGADFGDLARTYSEEPNANDSSGALGYFTVFAMVYSFETAAYNTQEGEVSEIVRTRFGYHILKVNDRREKLPKISVSHIMISSNKGARTFDPEVRINELYTMLQQGENFESLAKQFSDDKNSAVKGGLLNSFSKGELRSAEFEDAAYSLNSPGELSKPVQSEFGWHIIRLNEKLSIETFEEQKATLEKKVQDGGRSNIVTNAVNKKIKDKYGFSAGEDYLPFFENYVGDDVLSRRWVMDTLSAAQDGDLFTIGDRTLKYSQFASYISLRQRSTRPHKEKSVLLKELYNEFETQQLKQYFIDKLEDENEDYAAILSEYRDGLLIFDVMNKNIWQKAKNDSVGLQKYYDQTKESYKWKERVDVDVYSSVSNATALKVKELLIGGKSPEDIKATLNVDDKINVLLTQGVFEVDQRELPTGLDIKKGISDVIQSNESYVVTNIKGVIAPEVKALDDVKGKVLSNYQSHLEEEWMQELHSKYTVEINKKSLKRLKKEFK